MLVRTLEVAELVAARARFAARQAQADAAAKGLDPEDVAAGELSSVSMCVCTCACMVESTCVSGTGDWALSTRRQARRRWRHAFLKWQCTDVYKHVSVPSGWTRRTLLRVSVAYM
jgi:hypothetical protein